MRSDMNNFQKLLEEQSSQYEGVKRQKVQNNLLQTFGIFKFVGQLIDVYLPAMVNVIVSAMGGRLDENEKIGPPDFKNLPPDLGEGHPGKISPELPDLDDLR